MTKYINLGNEKFSIDVLKKYKENEYVAHDVEITNSHITSLNALTGRTLFRKDSLYINSTTLWELMQPLGGEGSHNYHGLTPEDIYNALKELHKPKAVIRVEEYRYAIISVELSSFNEPLMIVIQTGAELRGKINANINKVVTMYPKSDSDEYILKSNQQDVLFPKPIKKFHKKKNENRTGSQ